MSTSSRFGSGFDAPVRPGDVLAGKYVVERVIAVGGMGVVVAAKHEQLDQMVALKFVLPAAVGNRDAIERFVREARAVAKLKSEHVAKVLDVGTLASGAPYIVMEYLAGADLGQVLRDHGRLSIESAADFVLQACEAVAEAHSLGIVHRDIKPQNLFMTRGADGAPLIKVLDFGISKTITGVSDASARQLTMTNYVLGSPLYMAPEQMRSPRNVDARADVWALGVVLYQLIAGEAPFKGEAVPEICLKAICDPPDPIERTDVPQALRVVIARCLEKEPGARYANATELAAALLPFVPHVRRTVAQSQPQLPRPAQSDNALSATERALTPSPMGPRPAPLPPTPSAWGANRTTPRASRTRAVWGLALLFGVIAAVVVVASGRGIWLARRPPPAVGSVATLTSEDAGARPPPEAEVDAAPLQPPPVLLTSADLPVVPLAPPRATVRPPPRNPPEPPRARDASVPSARAARPPTGDEDIPTMR